MRQFVTALVLCLGTAAVAEAPRPFSRLYVFGDSYSDTGAGYVDGNGPTAVAYLAKRLAIPMTFAGDPKAAKDESLNYAVSGAQTGEGTGHRYPGGEFLSYGMKNQVGDFVAAVKSGKIHFQPQETMFFLAGGLNDRKLTTEITVANLEGEIDDLYGAGARRFEVALMPKKIPGFGVMGERLNDAIEKIPAEVKAKHPDADIRVSRWGLYFDEVLEHPANYGLTNTTDQCAGRTLRGEDPKPCATPGTYFYYHAAHPSTATHQAVGEMLYRELTGSAAP
jgi:phospholipase/lecithinase/hemolysin